MADCIGVAEDAGISDADVVRDAYPTPSSSTIALDGFAAFHGDCFLTDDQTGLSNVNASCRTSSSMP
jgi:hypothetical protein